MEISGKFLESVLELSTIEEVSAFEEVSVIEDTTAPSTSTPLKIKEKGMHAMAYICLYIYRDTQFITFL